MFTFFMTQSGWTFTICGKNIYLLQKLQGQVSTNKHYQGGSTDFVIHHYAGQVRESFFIISDFQIIMFS